MLSFGSYCRGTFVHGHASGVLLANSGMDMVEDEWSQRPQSGIANTRINNDGVVGTWTILVRGSCHCVGGAGPLCVKSCRRLFQAWLVRCLVDRWEVQIWLKFFLGFYAASWQGIRIHSQEEKKNKRFTLQSMHRNIDVGSNVLEIVLYNGV